MTMANGFAKQDHVNRGELTSHLVRTFNCGWQGDVSEVSFVLQLLSPLPSLHFKSLAYKSKIEQISCGVPGPNAAT